MEIKLKTVEDRELILEEALGYNGKYISLTIEGETCKVELKELKNAVDIISKNAEDEKKE